MNGHDHVRQRRENGGVVNEELSVGDPARRRAGFAIISSLAVVTAYGAVTVLAKEIPALELHQPWQDDPYDVPVSFDFVILPLLVIIGALRVQLCRRYEPLPARRLVDLVRAAWVAVGLSGVTALAEWTAVALGLHRAEWTAATTWQVAALGALSAAIVACGALLHQASRGLARRARAGAQPDWLADAILLGLREGRRLGPLQAPAESAVRWVDGQVIARVRSRPIAAAAALAGALALPFVAAKVVLEGYPAPLVAFVFALSAAALFAFVVMAGSYLRVVAPGKPGPSMLLCATVAACLGGPVVFAFHDSLLAAAHVPQTAGALGVLLFGGGAGAGLVSLAGQAVFRRARPSGRTSGPPGVT
jgi:hypothetical protein